ncbi:MAG: APC family permease [Deltaproteobacteria bacterium]|jgi:amino acid transporter|nr:APC family permease [Deltaproteobacteria bacterium]
MSNPPLPEAPRQTTALRRGLKPIAVFGTMFFLAFGGPYGVELLVPLAGPGLAVFSKVAMAILWGVPSALITAELVSAMPQEGGAYQWYRKGLSPFWTFEFSWLGWLNWFFDSAIYPTLIAAYLVAFFHPEASHLTSWAVCLAVIWAGTGLNIWGVEIVGRFSVALAIIVLIPALAMVILGWSEVSLSNLKPFVPDGQASDAWRYALIFGVWSFSGYAGLASAGEEIVDTENTYPKVLAIFVPFAVAALIIPLWVGLAADPNWSQWGPAQYTQVGFVLGGAWLAGAVSTAAQLSLLALFISELLILSRLPYAMARDGLLPKRFTRLHPRFGTPVGLLIVQALVLSALTYFWKFLDILVFATWLALPSYLLSWVLPFIIRWKHPGLRGPFRVPGGWLGLVLVTIAPVLISIYLIVTIEYQKLFLGLGCMAVGPLLYFSVQWQKNRSGAVESWRQSDAS